MSTLNITKVQIGEFKNKRGNHHKLDPEIVTTIKSHIESYPAVESHYTRAQSSRLYLYADLRIFKMHDQFQVAFPNQMSAILVTGEYFVMSKTTHSINPKKTLVTFVLNISMRLTRCPCKSA